MDVSCGAKYMVRKTATPRNFFETKSARASASAHWQGTTITVKESAAKNYKGSAEITINGTKLTSVAETSYNTELTAVRSQKLGQKQNIVDVTNTYNDVPVTGIIMNTLPYVLMIALCGVALIAFVGFKRRRLQK